MFYSTAYASPVGAITLASDGEKLVGLWLAGQKYFAATVKDVIGENPESSVFAITKKMA
ncbi:hypothetical protein LJB82_04625 [Desulfovibrio sp. OttesenSCG-928-M16]|nr:hypothetical protein [Desulfovibrio sp. OttesenSCG-928-M16]